MYVLKKKGFVLRAIHLSCLFLVCGKEDGEWVLYVCLAAAVVYMMVTSVALSSSSFRRHMNEHSVSRSFANACFSVDNRCFSVKR